MIYKLRTLLNRLPAPIRKRIHIPQVTAENPIEADVEVSGRVDLTIAGASREWGLERQTLDYYTDELAVRCQSSLLITRRYSQMSSHLASVLKASELEVAAEPQKPEVNA